MAIEADGINKAKQFSYFWGNLAKTVQDSTKGGLTVDSGRRIGTSSFKASKDYSHGDMVCTGLCGVSIACETASGVIVWIPIPGKVCAVSILKAISIGCVKVSDLCAAYPSNPLC